MPKLNVQQNNQNVIQAFKNALAIGNLKGIIASDGNHNFSTAGSNRNLLDNPFFTINQRGFTTSTQTNNVFSVDRWLINNGGGTVTKTANGITINNTSGTRYNTFQQRFGADELAGKTVTLSIDADGSIYKQTFTIPARTSSVQTMCNWAWKTGCNLRFYVETTSANASYNVQIYVANGYSTDLRAVKLELGTVSTLPNDAPPEVSAELQKCRYRYVPISLNQYSSLGWGFMTSGTAAEITIPLSSPFDLDGNTPTISITNSGNLKVVDAAGTNAITPTSWAVRKRTATTITIEFTIPSGYYSANTGVYLRSTGDATIAISADL